LGFERLSKGNQHLSTGGTNYGTVKDQPELRNLRLASEESLGAVFMLNNQLDSAYFHLQKLYSETLTDPYWHSKLLMFFGDLQFRRGNRELGLNYLRQSINIFQNNNDHYSQGDACRFISECFREMNMVDSSIFYAKKGLVEAQSIDYKSPILYNSRTLAELYESKDIGQALHYRKVFDSANDNYYGPAKVKDLQSALSNEQERQRKMVAAAIAYQNRLKQFGLLGGFCLILLVAFILYRNNQQKKKANLLLHYQMEKVESTLSELKSTQSQLIQSAKMASLGELTAGIAHEIQNPLNFVNNFSEVNKELIEELKMEAVNGNKDEVIAIAENIQTNEEKISYHGKRADTIVKGMLQHSRSGTGQRELVNINAIVEECLGLSYRSFRAKVKSFEADLQTEFDETFGPVSVVQQNIVQVLINILNNAFYAVNEKSMGKPPGYRPVVCVSTRRVEDKVQVSVKDNGNGISEKVRDKIFQPFFTTKPAGQGTGLGLSLSYDMVKSHGGEIILNTMENAGSEFIIEFPIKH
jgi:two-component system, NtrC family, sensor kinase